MIEPKFQDRVRHKSGETSGTVIAKYPLIGTVTNGIFKIRSPGLKTPKGIKLVTKQFIDVRTLENEIIYETPAENWEVMTSYEN